MFKDTLKKERKKMKLSQEELASKLGIGKTTICNYETGVRNPDSNMLVKIANVLNVTTDYLLGFDKSYQPDPTLHYSGNKRIMSAIDTLSNSDISDDDLNVIEAVLLKYKR